MSPSAAAKAAQRARVARSAAAANAAVAAHNAASAAQVAAHNAAVAAAGAAQNAGGAAQTAASAANKGMRQGVYAARSWAAPRIDNAADYCTTTVAPKVSAALHSTARQVAPVETTSKKSSIMTWSLLGAAVLAALGAGAAMVRYRYRTAIAADSAPADEEAPGDPADSQAGGVNPDGSSATRPKDSSSETSANGRVTATGW